VTHAYFHERYSLRTNEAGETKLSDAGMPMANAGFIAKNAGFAHYSSQIDGSFRQNQSAVGDKRYSVDVATA
jgi:hypothetical protein